MRSLPRSILSRQVQSERSLVNDRCDEISSKYGYSGFSEKSDKPLGSGVLRKERNVLELTVFLQGVGVRLSEDLERLDQRRRGQLGRRRNRRRAVRGRQASGSRWARKGRRRPPPGRGPLKARRARCRARVSPWPLPAVPKASANVVPRQAPGRTDPRLSRQLPYSLSCR